MDKGDEAKEGAQDIVSEYSLGAWVVTVTFTVFRGTRREASVTSKMSSFGGYVDFALPGISR